MEQIVLKDGFLGTTLGSCYQPQAHVFDKFGFNQLFDEKEFETSWLTAETDSQLVENAAQLHCARPGSKWSHQHKRNPHPDYFSFTFLQWEEVKEVSSILI